MAGTSMMAMFGLMWLETYTNTDPVSELPRDRDVSLPRTCVACDFQAKRVEGPWHLTSHPHAGPTGLIVDETEEGKRGIFRY